MNTKQIALWLNENCTMQPSDGCAPNTGIKNIYSYVFNNGKISNAPKNICTTALAEWYADKQHILDLWNGSPTGSDKGKGLNAIEKEFISVYMQYNCIEFVPATKAIAEKHGIQPPVVKRTYYSTESDFYDTSGYPHKYLYFLHLIKKQFPRTKATYLFPGGKTMPPFVSSVLKDVIPSLRFTYTAFTPAETDRLICREHRLADISAVVRFTVGEKLKVKAGTLDITKAKLAKMVESIGFEEVCDNNGIFCSPKEAAYVHDLKVALPLYLLTANIGLIKVGQDLLMRPSENAIEMLSKPLHELTRDIFKAYLASKTIFETRYITSLALRESEYTIDWASIRFPIIKLLTACPVGQFVRFDEFDQHACIFCGRFVNDQVYNGLYVRGFSSSYYGRYTPDWQECESQIIRLILSFCGALGMLDIAYTEKVSGYKMLKDDYRVGISGFRITPLGAWILGMTKEYDIPVAATQTAEGELIVQPDHTVIISGLKKRVTHEAYLSQFLSKVSIDEHVAVYKIDFTGMVRALDQRITPSQIKNYLTTASNKPLPENVIRSFDDWQIKVGRVKVRNVTVLEADDALLLQELIHIKGMQKFSSDLLGYGVVIDDDAKKKVKALVEKNGWLVQL